MKKHTTSIVLGVIAIGLVAFIFFYERNTLTTGDVEARQGKMIQRFVRDRVTQLEIQRGDERVVLEREVAPPTPEGEEPATATYRLTAPVRAEADDEAVESLLGALEWASARRTLTEVTTADLHTFGLDSPRVRASFTVAGTRIPVAVGGEDVHGGGVYVQLEDPATVYVAGIDFFEALDHGAEHFRSKELFGELDVALATKLAREGVFEILREGRADRFASPALGAASSAKVTELLDKLADLRVSRYLEADLGAVAATYRIEHEGTVVRLRIGGECTGHEGERLARIDDEAVICLPDSGLEMLLAATPESLREMRVVTVRDEEVRRIELAVGDRTLTVEKADDAWTTKQRDGGAERRGTADPAAVLAYMRALRGLRAEAFEEGPPGRVSATLRIFGEEDAALETISLLAADPTNVRAQRSLDDALLKLPGAAAELFAISSLRFRARLVIDEDDEEATRIEVERPGLTERLVRDDEGAWNVAAPSSVAADGPSLRELVRDASSLETARFVAEQAAPEHGLDHPRAVATFHYERAEDEGDEHGHAHEDEHEEPERAPQRRYVIEVGADTADGAFARLRAEDGHGGPEVFLLPASIARLLVAPLASRDEMATEADALESIVVEEGGRRVTVSATDLETLGAELAGLRAAEVRSYGDAPVGALRRRIVVTRKAGAPEPHEMTIEIGAAASEGRLFARRSGVPLLYVVEERALSGLLTLPVP